LSNSVSTLTPADFARSGWDDIRAWYDELARRPLSLATAEEWLRHWSLLESSVAEAAALAMIAYTGDTRDPVKEADHLRFSGEILPKMEEQGVRLADRLLDLDYRRPELEVLLRKLRTQREIFRAENVPLFTQVEELSSQYQKITGAITVAWEGQEKTIPELQPVLKSPDRSVRERAFRVASGAYVERREELAAIFDRLLALRATIATNAGLADYQAYAFRSKFRFDYTPADCDRFHQAVEAVVVPAVERLFKRRRRRLGVATLRPWDIGADPDHRPPVRPFQTVRELIEISSRVFGRVSPAFGHEFRLMAQEGLLDLETRKGKAPGGYCETLHYRGRPFIFMNAAGVVDDVSTLLHEGGHAFHAFATHHWPLVWLRHPGLEMCELASMSMELLAAPFLGRAEGGFFVPEDLARARVEHFEDLLISLAHIAAVDAFQSWIYTSGRGGDARARDEAWLAIRGRFERGLDWSGLEADRAARWHRQLHIFLYPFYYIEYGIAQLGALQVWRNSLTDPADAVRRYREALGLGDTRSLPELYAAAGASLVFDQDGMQDLVDLVERHLEAWEADGR
jgi:oligoendopeptidase F